MIIAPSLLNSKLYEFKKNIKIFREYHINELHIDIMDGCFVPDQANGPKLIQDIRPLTDLLFDVHLMIDKPEEKIANYLKVGADSITFHIEATSDAMYIINTIKEAKVEAGIAVNPGTSLYSIIEILPYVDRVLVMTANPGRSGERFHDGAVDKIKKLSELRENSDYQFIIQADGKVDKSVVRDLEKAGCDHIVSGGYIFNSDSPGKQIDKLQKEMKAYGK
ncbi:hypothetical protein AWM75_07915 [Aerococcus urinaehominis]|uniref:Uncharacterized protein n=1 Tax=Aerococcus urinaehominis TaxID=128944 RepID=A0A0X8FM77_9LACT|nr:ribulose-phosphate 3-epimerase [Aerococcus urinaehominis]AMB99898.1 hypothetical protein AWM75_07915 [Aerococcus urinaehominis]SDM52585.1 ribulose-phosphate 3-epimerase [Aerococcus urinaehominis]